MLGLKAIEIHKTAKYGTLHTHLKEFDQIRHELHQYARKGPKTLTEWPSC
jgi:hypothetical protein